MKVSEFKDVRTVRFRNHFFREIRFSDGNIFQNQSVSWVYFWSKFEEKTASKKPCFDSIDSSKTTNVSLFVLSQKAWLWSKTFHWKKNFEIIFSEENQIWNKSLTTCQNSMWKSLVRFWNKVLTTRQILKKKYHNTSDLESKLFVL